MAVALPADAEGEGPSAPERIEADQKLLAKAIELLDYADAPPELAARVQEANDAIVKHRGALPTGL
jgi:hypothetical protein